MQWHSFAALVASFQSAVSFKSFSRRVNIIGLVTFDLGDVNTFIFSCTALAVYNLVIRAH